MPEETGRAAAGTKACCVLTSNSVKARTLAAEKRNVLSQLARAREAKDRLAHETAEEKSRLEMELLQQKARTLEAKGRLEEEEEDKLCCSA